MCFHETDFNGDGDFVWHQKELHLACVISKHSIRQLVCLLLFATSGLAQKGTFEVGERWPYHRAYVRHQPDTVYLHDFIFHEGLAAVVFNKQVGFIDSNKTIRIPIRYDDQLGCNEFKNGTCIVAMNKRWGVINTHNEIILPLQYERITRYDGGFLFESKNAWGYADERGKISLPLSAEHGMKVFTQHDIVQKIKQYDERIAKEKQVTCSKEKVIDLAKSRGYYDAENGMHAPSVQLDSLSKNWIIQTYRYIGTTYRGDCAHTNGCSIYQTKSMVVDAQTGKIIRQTKHKTRIPNYE
jgi:hypothetical protein